MNPDTIEPRRRILSPRKLAQWGVESAAAGGLLYLANMAGLGHMYFDLAASLSQADLATQAIHNIGEVIKNPEALQPAAMGIGFMTGAITTTVFMPEVVSRLKGRVRFQGSGNYEIVDGMRVVDNNCIDGRIDPAHQDNVEPGAGLMGGAFVKDNIIGLAIHNALGNGLAQDFAIGYMLGRSLPPAIISALRMEVTALYAPVQSFLQDQGPLLENQHPHDKGCGWSATVSFLKHYLKFSEGDHERKIALLDALNTVDGFFNTSIWEPIIGMFATPTSLFTYFVEPTNQTTSIHDEKHS